MKGTGSPTFGPGETATESATGYGIGRGNGSGTRDSKTGSARFVADSRSTLTYTERVVGLLLKLTKMLVLYLLLSLLVVLLLYIDHEKLLQLVHL